MSARSLFKGHIVPVTPDGGEFALVYVDDDGSPRIVPKSRVAFLTRPVVLVNAVAPLDVLSAVNDLLARSEAKFRVAMVDSPADTHILFMRDAPAPSKPKRGKSR